jgi:hypothetical protein
MPVEFCTAKLPEPFIAMLPPLGGNKRGRKAGEKKQAAANMLLLLTSVHYCHLQRYADQEITCVANISSSVSLRRISL